MIRKVYIPSRMHKNSPLWEPFEILPEEVRNSPERCRCKILSIQLQTLAAESLQQSKHPALGYIPSSFASLIPYSDSKTNLNRTLYGEDIVSVIASDQCLYPKNVRNITIQNTNYHLICIRFVRVIWMSVGRLWETPPWFSFSSKNIAVFKPNITELPLGIQLLLLLCTADMNMPKFVWTVWERGQIKKIEKRPKARPNISSGFALNFFSTQGTQALFTALRR